VGEFFGAFRAEDVEKLQYRLRVAALGCPHQPAGIVIDHAGEIPLSLAVGDFVDPDAAQPGQQVGLPGPLGHDAFDDGLYRPPGDAQELRHRRGRGAGGPPRHHVLKGVGVPRFRARPGHVRDDDPMLRAGHPGDFSFEVDHGGAPVQAPPPPRLTAPVVARTPSLTLRTSPALPNFRPDPQDQIPLAVPACGVPVGRLDHRVLDPQEVP